MIRAAIYLRISRDSAARGLGVDRQFTACQELLARKSWQHAATFTDNDVSASRRKGGVLPTRPDFQALCAAITAGTLDAVVAWDADRLFRDPLEREQFLLLCERHAFTHIATIEDSIDIESGNGLLVFRLKTDIAAEETRKISRRQKAKLLQLAEAGEPGGGAPGVPYRRHPDHPGGFVTDETEVRLVVDAARKVLAGGSWRQVVRDWNAAGFQTRRGNKWCLVSVVNVLTAPRLAGLRVHRGEIIGPGNWPAVISLDDHHALVARHRLYQARAASAPTPRKHYLTGLVYCAECERPMVALAHFAARAGGVKRRTERYTCHKLDGGCGQSIYIPGVVDAVTTLIAGLATSPKVLAAVEQQRNAHVPTDLFQQLDNLKARMSDLEDGYYLRGDIAAVDYKRIKADLNTRLAVLELTANQHTATHPVTVAMQDKLNGMGITIDEFRVAFEANEVGDRNLIARQFIHRVSVHLPTAIGRASVPSSRVSITLATSTARAVSTILNTPSSSVA